MDAQAAEDRLIVGATVRKMLDAHYGFDIRQRACAAGELHLWQRFAHAGLLTLIEPAEGRVPALMVATVTEVLGRYLVCEPFIASAVLASRLLTFSTRPEAQALRVQLERGERRAALASCVPGELGIGMLGASEGDILLAVAPMAGSNISDFLVILPNASGRGLSIAHVTPTPQERSDCPTFDGMGMTELRLAREQAGASVLIEDAASALQSTLDLGLVALCAEAVGCMSVLLDKTLAYTRMRQQFGTTISSFQVLQHRMADMHMSLEEARSLVEAAAAAVEEQRPEAAALACAAKAYIGGAGRRIGQDAVQLHGAVGLTNALDVGHYFKRLTAIDLLLGDADQQIGRFARLGRAREEQAA